MCLQTNWPSLNSPRELGETGGGFGTETRSGGHVFVGTSYILFTLPAVSFWTFELRLAEQEIGAIIYWRQNDNFNTSGEIRDPCENGQFVHLSRLGGSSVLIKKRFTNTHSQRRGGFYGSGDTLWTGFERFTDMCGLKLARSENAFHPCVHPSLNMHSSPAVSFISSSDLCWLSGPPAPTRHSACSPHTTAACCRTS